MTRSPSHSALPSSLVELTAPELRHLIARREVSPVELLEACIARIEAVNPYVNAITATCRTARAPRLARPSRRCCVAMRSACCTGCRWA